MLRGLALQANPVSTFKLFPFWLLARREVPLLYYNSFTVFRSTLSEAVSKPGK